MAQLANYKLLVTQLKAEIQSARIKASLSANVQMLALYWKLGTAILKHQQAEGWGAKIIDNLAKDLRSEFPDMKGISPRNLKYMRAFAEAYPQFVQQVAAPTTNTKFLQEPLANKGESGQPGLQSQNNPMMQVPLAPLNETEFVQAPLAQIPWYHHITLLDKIKNPEERLFYMHETATHGWSRNVMVHHIESGLYHRKGKAVSNFETTLPSPQSDLARELLKDPYKFDFLNLGEEHQERDLENALVDHITKFLLELGQGFCYAGRQYRLVVDDEEFFLDLLFYHLKLRCFVVIELKARKFIPEYAGKLNFYLNVVDDQLRHPADAPTIGILICKERNKVIAEYALRNLNKPIGISEYQLTESIPEDLKGSLPTIEEIENSLNDIAT